MPAVHGEVEKKYAVDESFELPPLTELVTGSAERCGAAVDAGSPVAEGEAGNLRLEAPYLATWGLRLAVEGLTPRRPPGGGDAGGPLRGPPGAPGRPEGRPRPGRAAPAGAP